MRRRFAMRRGTRKPANVQWSDVSQEFTHTGISATAAAVLIQLQSPAALSALTSDPPEDLTVLRIVGDFRVALSNTALQDWTLALTVADVTWTPAAFVRTDNDKRLLWQMSYTTFTAATAVWQPPGNYFEAAAQGFPCPREYVHLDIAPKVKVEAGKALYLVAYENVATAGTLTVSSSTMRVLYKRSGRR